MIFRHHFYLKHLRIWGALLPLGVGHHPKLPKPPLSSKTQQGRALLAAVCTLQKGLTYGPSLGLSTARFHVILALTGLPGALPVVLSSLRVGSSSGSTELWSRYFCIFSLLHCNSWEEVLFLQKPAPLLPLNTSPAVSPTLCHSLLSPPGSRTAPVWQSAGDSSPGVTQASPETVVQGHCMEQELSLWVSTVTSCHGTQACTEPATTQLHPRLASALAGQPHWAPQAALMVLPACLNSSSLAGHTEIPGTWGAMCISAERL